jgi:hypothetical protein
VPAVAIFHKIEADRSGNQRIKSTSRFLLKTLGFCFNFDDGILALTKKFTEFLFESEVLHLTKLFYL